MPADQPLDEIAIRVADLVAAAAFYKTAAVAAGFELRSESSELASFAHDAGGQLLLIPGPPTEALHIAFPGGDDSVRRFHADAVAAGHRSFGEPHERPRYQPGYSSAYVLDPDGNNIELIDHHRP